MQKGGNLAGAALMGMLSALLAGPCMTAPLAGALLFISQTQSQMQGALLRLRRFWHGHAVIVGQCAWCKSFATRRFVDASSQSAVCFYYVGIGIGIDSSFIG